MGKKVTFEEFKSRLAQRKDVEYLDGFVNMHTKCHFKCKVCGNKDWYTTPHDLFRPRYCPKCSNKKRGDNLRDLHYKDKQDYLQYLLDTYLDDPTEYTWLDEYHNDNKERLHIKHNKCGNIYLTTPNEFQQGNGRCVTCQPAFKESKAVMAITDLLDAEDICYQKEVTLKGLPRYRFDFMIRDLLIEIDGVQHFQENTLFNQDNKNREKDNIKNKFVLDHNYRLIRIPYMESNQASVDKVIRIFEAMIDNGFSNLKGIANHYNLYYIYNRTTDRSRAVLNEDSYYNENDELANSFDYCNNNSKEISNTGIDVGKAINSLLTKKNITNLLSSVTSVLNLLDNNSNKNMKRIDKENYKNNVARKVSNKRPKLK